MNNRNGMTGRTTRLWYLAILALFVVGGWTVWPAMAQTNGGPPAPGEDTNGVAEQGPQPMEMGEEGAAKGDEGEAGAEASDEVDATGIASPDSPKKINLLKLLVRGGGLMWPIALMSFLVVTFGVERSLALRRHKVLPPQLINGLGKLAAQKGGLDPRQAYKLCQQYPSTASTVIKTMLLKVGRPHTEVEHAVSEASEREAARLYSNVRWIGLAAGISPLLGLLGTVWGMIQAFFATANLPTGANKAQILADGIYVALVTTFAGLAVAIPAAVLAHLFEGRIQSLFRELDEALLGLMPQLERFEGRLRVSREQMDEPAAEAAAEKTAPAAAHQPATSS